MLIASAGVSACQFQSTRPRGARLARRCLSDSLAMFQSTRPRGARRLWIAQPPRRSACFNPRAREGRDNGFDEESSKLFAFQSTRPRGARRHRCGDPLASCQVSIHAPARGATLSYCEGVCNLRVSIHAPARGATREQHLRPDRRHRFNPRAREGRDPVLVLPSPCHRPFQSTRPRGARPGLPRRCCSSRASFNPRAREGRDAKRRQRAPPPTGFNPRAREGRDSGRRVVPTIDLVSIHAPARGATGCAAATVTPNACFNPRAREGRDGVET